MIHNSLDENHTVERFTLNQIEVVRLLEDTILETTTKTFQIAVIDVELLKPHSFFLDFQEARSQQNYKTSTVIWL